jgi:hypothetical protein
MSTMTIKDVEKRIHELRVAVEKTSYPWVAAQHTIFLTDEDLDSILRDKSFDELPPGIAWYLVNNREFQGVHIIIVKELPTTPVTNP